MRVYASGTFGPGSLLLHRSLSDDTNRRSVRRASRTLRFVVIWHAPLTIRKLNIAKRDQKKRNKFGLFCLKNNRKLCGLAFFVFTSPFWSSHLAVGNGIGLKLAWQLRHKSLKVRITNEMFALLRGNCRMTVVKITFSSTLKLFILMDAYPARYGTIREMLTLLHAPFKL